MKTKGPILIFRVGNLDRSFRWLAPKSAELFLSAGIFLYNGR